jgi:hypothetical protein
VGAVNELDAWIAAACAELGLDPDEVSAKAVLDVARDVAHQVLRPGAPVSAYLMGVAVGRGADPSDVAARLSALALSWAPHEDRGDRTRSAPSAAGAAQAGGAGAGQAAGGAGAAQAGGAGAAQVGADDVGGGVADAERAAPQQPDPPIP